MVNLAMPAEVRLERVAIHNCRLRLEFDLVRDPAAARCDAGRDVDLLALCRRRGDPVDRSGGVRAAEARAMARDAGAATNPPVTLFIGTGPDDYVIAARGLKVYFTAATEPSDSVALATAEEGVYAGGKWIPGRRLNGDETPEWKALRFGADNYTLQHVKLYRYR